MLAFYATGGWSNGPTEALNLLTKKGQAGRARLSQLRQLRHAAAIVLRWYVAESPDRRTASRSPRLVA
jgi:hypothetical protein